MSEGARISRTEALPLAEELVALLSPYCERIEVLGSLRRLKADVGDIEVLVVPKVKPVTDLFGDPTDEETDLLNEECRRMLSYSALGLRLDKNGRPAFGLKYKRLTYKDFALDLFSVVKPAQWGVLSVIRTGSAAFSHRLVTPVEQGGWCPKGYCFRHGAIWAVDHWEALETPDEEAVFAAIGREYVPPEQREVKP